MLPKHNVYCLCVYEALLLVTGGPARRDSPPCFRLLSVIIEMGCDCAQMPNSHMICRQPRTGNIRREEEGTVGADPAPVPAVRTRVRDG